MNVEQLLKQLQTFEPKAEIKVGWRIEMASLTQTPGEPVSVNINGVNGDKANGYVIFIESPEK
jgi:hypothetical protein